MTVTKLFRTENYHQRPGDPAWIRRVEYETKKPVKPIIRCNCGRLIGLAAHHVHANGNVTASFEHRATAEDPGGCGWHVCLFLVDYNDGHFLAANDPLLAV